MKQKMKQKMGLFKVQLKEREMNKVKGGHCQCGCLYVNCGGSSTDANGAKNLEGGLHSPRLFPPVC